MKYPTMLSHYLCGLVHSLHRQGLDPQPLLKAAGISEKLASDPNARISYEQFSNFLRKTYRLLDDEHLGMSASALPLGAFYHASLLMVAAPSLRQALERATRFYNYIDRSSQLRLVEGESGITLTIKRSDAHKDPDHILGDFLLCCWHRFSCWLVGQTIVLKGVSFDFPRPSHVAEYQFMFPCFRTYDQNSLSLTFNCSYLDLPVVRTERELQAFIKRSPLGFMESPSHDDSYTTKIRHQLEIREQPELPTFEVVADRLHMTPKTLRQKLQSEGTNYQQVKDQVRRDQAIYYLTQQNHPVQEVAHRVGFTETSAFIRAFKNWTGLTPGAYRNQEAPASTETN